jgi:hypothetical protein
MAGIAISLDCILIGIVVKLIVISLDCVSMDVNGGFNSGFDGGFDSRFHLAVLGYWLQWSAWQLRWAAFTAISQEGLTGLCCEMKSSFCRLVLQASLNELIVLRALSKALWMPLLTALLMAIIIVM